MDYLQYYLHHQKQRLTLFLVLNLIINGLPSILENGGFIITQSTSFKPYYKWITFNTKIEELDEEGKKILSFKPYYKWITFNTLEDIQKELHDTCFKPYYKWITFNTISANYNKANSAFCFKPYYKWITFNTEFQKQTSHQEHLHQVLNLIINGLPSILQKHFHQMLSLECFKPYYKWITFNTKKRH